MDSKAKRAELSGEIFLRSRFDAGISQDHMALALGITRQTIRNWERGISSPTIFQASEWFRELGLNPLPYFLRNLFPDQDISNSGKSEKQITAALGDVISCLTSRQKRELLFVLSGDHGSSAPAVLELNTAYLHLPLIARFPIATGIHSCYIALQKLGLTVCPDSILPDLDVLRRAIEEADRAIRNNKSGYTSLPTGGDLHEAP